jgi:hypothetical protein
MKKNIILLIISLLTVILQAQTLENYSIKVEGSIGSVLKLDYHSQYLAINRLYGGGLSVEWQTMGDKAWHHYFNFPKTGFSASFTTLGNKKMLGNMFAFYPYLQFPLYRSNIFSFNIKSGVGISLITKYYGNTPHIEGRMYGLGKDENGVASTMINCFFYLGLNVEIPVNERFSITANYAFNHASNGSIAQPNRGINMVNNYLGVKYSPKYKNTFFPEKNKSISNISPEIQYELTLSGGVRQLFYYEKKKYPIASLAFAAYKPLNNCYRMGLGVDVFYNAMFGYLNVPWKEGVWTDVFIAENKLKNKIRGGISWQNELMFGKLTAGFHFGIYLYDNIKNLQTYDDVGYNPDGYGLPLKKGIFYKYNHATMYGWNYFRVVAKYRFSGHYFVSVGVKTHLARAEFIEWGLGYSF